MSEKDVVRKLGEKIGYGRLMQLAEEIWGEVCDAAGHSGGNFTRGPCASEVEPCPHLTSDNPSWRDKHDHCEWCCGVGRVTERVARAMRAITPTDGDSVVVPRERLEKLEELERRIMAMMTVFQEGRDALTVITEQQRKLRGISATLADRMDELGEADRWRAMDKAARAASQEKE